jgi:hypothetical protein
MSFAWAGGSARPCLSRPTPPSVAISKLATRIHRTVGELQIQHTSNSQGSITSPQALVGAEATPPTTGTAPTAAEVMRQGAAKIEQPDKARSVIRMIIRMQGI